MEVYLVGGAVRDELLGQPVRERDWVVVGSTPQAMLDAGYRQVGRDFPVFLHPETGEEYALARTERKTGSGYHGFELRFSPDVTLEDDLRRRDLTVNAIARAPGGGLIDPCGGQRDLEAHTLRHVSEAFNEDPVRILRVARFLARLQPLGFSVAPETLVRMRAMVASGEVDALYGVPQPEKWHPEIDTDLHMELVLQAAADLTPEPRIRFAALMHDLGKGRTPRSQWPTHRGHEERGVALLRTLAARLRVPGDYRDLAELAARWHGLAHRAMELRPRTLLELLEACDATRRPDRFRELLLAFEADYRGRGGWRQRPYPQAERLSRALAVTLETSLDDADRAGLPGEQIGVLLRRRRLAALRQMN